MKINEITNAEDMLALWKLISDNTWSAIQQQAEQQAREKAANTKSTKAPKRGVGRKPPPIAPPKPKLPDLPALPQVKTANIAPVQQPVVSKGALPKKGPWGAANTPMSTAATSLPTKPVAPSADALQKPGSQLKLMAREKGVVRV